jgi:hypothetical protein
LEKIAGSRKTQRPAMLHIRIRIGIKKRMAKKVDHSLQKEILQAIAREENFT